MAKPFDQVVTMKDVYEYARDSYLAASKPGCVVLAGPNKGLSCYCPNAAPQYQNLANEINASIAGGLSGSTYVDSYKKGIEAINSACRQEAGWVKPPPTPGVIPPSLPPPAGVQKAGFPWWVVLLLGGGALVYYLSQQKKGSSLSRGEHLVQKVKSKRRKARGRRKKR